MLFSEELPWCYFCAEIKVLGMTWKSTENYFGIYNKYWKEDPRQGGLHVSTRVGARPPASWAPSRSTDLNPDSIYSLQGEKTREKDSSRFMIRSHRQALNSLGRADLESPIHCLRAFHILFFAYLLFRCYCYHHYKTPKILLLLLLPFTTVTTTIILLCY